MVWYIRDPTTGVGSIDVMPNGNFLTDLFPYTMAEYSVTGQTLARWEFGDGPAGTTAVPATTSVAPSTTAAATTSSTIAVSDAATGFVESPDTVWVHADWIKLSVPHHDITVMPNGNLLALARTVHPVTEAFRKAQCPGDNSDWGIISDVAVEFERSGKVLHTWDDWDVIDAYTHPGHELCATTGLFANQLERDWSHANAVMSTLTGMSC